MSQVGHQHAKRFEEEYLPMARTEDLVVTQSENEALVYDKRSHHIHHMGADAATVWHHSNGRRSTAIIAAESGLTHHQVVAHLVTLGNLELLNEPVPFSIEVPRRSRRSVAKAGIGALGGIISISAASAASNGSCVEPNAGDCFDHSDCCPVKRVGLPDVERVCIQNAPDLPGYCN